jgi:hypothetical protein
MAKLIKEVSVITGSYTNADGMKKNRYTRIGSIIETQNGPMLKIDTIPLKEGGWDGWAYMNDPKPKDDYAPKTNYAPRAKASFEDDDSIPF